MMGDHHVHKSTQFREDLIMHANLAPKKHFWKEPLKSKFWFSRTNLGIKVLGLIGTLPAETWISQEQWQVSQNGFGSPLRDI